jgi:hypothetical protein
MNVYGLVSGLHGVCTQGGSEVTVETLITLWSCSKHLLIELAVRNRDGFLHIQKDIVYLDLQLGFPEDP